MKIKLLFCFLVGICLISCKVEDKHDAAKEKPNKKDRNMFGHRIPRGVTVTSEGLTDGYVMFAVPNSASFYLINRKGEVVHEWKGRYSGMSGYLMDDGSLVANALDPDYPVFAFGGQMGRLQKISWDGKQLWDFEYATDEHLVHHDLTVLPNGNVLAIAYEAKSYEDALAMGRKPDMMPKTGPWLEQLLEIEPQGKTGGKIVWEWHVKDHLIQNFDPKKANYGNPADHPELIDFNRGRPMPAPISQDSVEVLQAMGREWRNTTAENRGSDIYHFNSVKYNADLDQIVFGSPDLGEIFIIDHGTTTKEAAGHKGGKRGRGGDLLYRWGNPQNYQRGDSTDQKLFGQHDVRWIEKGKPGAGNLTIFNNDNPRPKDSLNYSTVIELKPPLDETGNYTLERDGPFGPAEPKWTYMAHDTVSFYSSFISGAHRMDNGNMFINEGARGRFFEVTPQGKIVWEYLQPFRGEIRKPNGEPNSIMPMTYFIFRSTFIPATHPAFAGKVLKPLEPQPKPFVLPPPPPKDEKKKS